MSATTSTTSTFQPATRKRKKLRAAIDGPSGSGKSATAQRFAMALAASIGPAARVACIDSEHGSASVYAGDVFAEGERPIAMDVMELASYSPSEYSAAIEAAGRAKYDVLIVDSLSHAWEGMDGALEQVSRAGGNKFTAWKDVTPMHRRMVEAILSSPCHVIATMRSKVEYVLEDDDKGKKVPRKVGVAPIQRPGMEYEFDVYCSMDWNHILTVTKTRCRLIDGLVAVKPGAAFLLPVIDWLNAGTGMADVIRTPSPLIRDEQLQGIVEMIAAMGWSRDRVVKELPKRYETDDLHKLTADQADNLAAWLAAQGKAKGKQATQQQAKTPQQQQQATPVGGSIPPIATASPPASPSTTASPAPQANGSHAADPPATDPVGSGTAALEASVRQPMTDTQAARLKELLNEWCDWNIQAAMQGTKTSAPLNEEDATAYIRNIFKEILKTEYGVAKTSELSIAGATKLTKWLESRIKDQRRQDEMAAQNPF